MDIIELIQSRRTIRKFEQKPLTEEQLMRYVNAARVAPSAANLQPLKYVVVQSPHMVKELFPLVQWAGYLHHQYDPKDGERPVAYIVLCADRTIKQNGYEQDEGAAVEHIILSAWSEGVGTCWIGSVDRAKVKTLLGLEDDHEIVSVVALGYPAEMPREVVCNGDIKYYLEGETLCVPKRIMKDVLIKTV